MMCDNCKSGGDLKAAGRILGAKIAHDMCWYPKSCTCLHRVEGQWINA